MPDLQHSEQISRRPSDCPFACRSFAVRLPVRPLGEAGHLPYGDLRPSRCFCRAAFFFVQILETQFVPTQFSIQGMNNKEAIGMVVGMLAFGAVISAVVLIAVIMVL